MNIQDTLNNLKAIGDEVKALQAKAKKARTEAMEPFLQALADSGKVSLIVIRGYTPGFNDGEPCEHSSDFYVNIEEIANEEILGYGFEGLPFDTEWLEDIPSTKKYVAGRGYEPIVEGLMEAEKICAEHGHIWYTPDEEIISAISSVIYETIEEDFGTDYWVIFTLENGKMVRYEGHYDCGH